MSCDILVKMLALILILTILNTCLLTNGAAVAIFSGNCGKSLNATHPDWRIVGGTDAAVGEFPWQIILTLAHATTVDPEDYNFCGGSIINERWILTAEHCVHQIREETLMIRLGVHNFTINETDKEVNIFVEKLVHHEGYKQLAVVNDIALIKLNESLDFNGKHQHLSPICLAKSDINLTKKCVATGFGSVNPDKQVDPENGILKKVDILINDPGVCLKEWAHLFNESTEVCAGATATGGHSICDGDSGGPLQCQGEDGLWYQIGIVSYGPNRCAAPHEADVFMKVSAYFDWIQKKIASN